jgi:NADPH:quinone reductase-like Zn-dependent oxidoreductase
MLHRSSWSTSNWLPALTMRARVTFPLSVALTALGTCPTGNAYSLVGAGRRLAPWPNGQLYPKAFAFPVPDNLSDELAADLPNPGVSAWLALTYRAKLASGENVLVLGGTGVAGRLAVQIAKLLGAGRVVAAGRDQNGLAALREFGADATIRLDATQEELQAAFLQTAGDSGFQIVIDYVWGPPTEAFLNAVTKREFSKIGSELRLVQVGESAGATISLPAAVLRSTPLTILGTAGIPSLDVLKNGLQQVMAHAASGQLRMETESVRLAEIEDAWHRRQRGRRIVMVP